MAKLDPGSRSYQLPLWQPGSPWKPVAELPSFAGAKRLGFDVETYDPELDEYGPGVRRGGYVIGYSLRIDDRPPCYLPVRHDGGGNLDPGLVERYLRTEAREFRGEVFGANLLYDLDFSAEAGIEFTGARAFHDVQVIEPLLDADRFAYNLGALARDYLGEAKNEELLLEAAKSYGARTLKEAKRVMWRMPASVVGPYAETDALLPMEIFPLQYAKLEAEAKVQRDVEEAPNTLLDIYEVERKLMVVLLGMRRRGVRVNLRTAERVRAQFVELRDAALAKLRHLTHSKVDFNSDNLGSALADRGLPVTYTATGKVSTRKEWLQANAHDEAVAAVLEGRKYDTAINTFIDGHVGHAIRGRVHCTFNQLKTDDSGTIARLSSEDPNLQNLPARDKKIGPLTRSIFEPDEGPTPDQPEDWERQDQSQIEYRLLANDGRGKTKRSWECAIEVRKRYNTDPTTDFHAVCGSLIGADAKDAFIRKRVKNTNFCKVYGGGIPKIASTFGCSVEEAARFVEKYDRELPFVQDTYDYAETIGRMRGHINTIGGRRMRFNLWVPIGDRKALPLPRPEAEKKYGRRLERYKTYRALNFRLQGGAADVMKKGMVDSYEAGCFAPGALGFPLVTVHDELGLSKRRDRAAIEAAAEVKRLCEVVYKLRVPLLVDANTGPTWGDCK